MADDVEAIIRSLEIGKFVLVGHSMGGKVAQIVAKRQPAGLERLILVGPAPPTPMEVPPEQRDAMLASYGSREGVLQALTILSGSVLPDPLREQVIEDTLSGQLAAKRAWTQSNMLADVSPGLEAVRTPVTVVVGDRDRVEEEGKLRAIFMRYFPQAQFRVLPGIGHLSPLESPESLAEACFKKLSNMAESKESKNKTLVLEAFGTLFNKRDYAAAERFWSPNYVQHSAHIGPGREGLFDLIRNTPSTLKWEHGVVLAEGDYVIVHSRYSGTGLPAAWVVADIVRMENGILAEHWDVIQDEATREQSKSGAPMFGRPFRITSIKPITFARELILAHSPINAESELLTQTPN
jgi:predicted SnoaL-like aldol condensation-catalyzing enzyme/surfactin synthase thioesterase subunit